MTDISEPALEKAKAKVAQLVPGAGRVEITVRAAPWIEDMGNQRPLTGTA